jgi:hypothetical protein
MKTVPTPDLDVDQQLWATSQPPPDPYSTDGGGSVTSTPGQQDRHCGVRLTIVSVGGQGGVVVEQSLRPPTRHR